MNECLSDFLTSDQALVSRVLQPLLTLPGTCSLQKGDVCVERRDVIRSRILERAFLERSGRCHSAATFTMKIQ